MAHAIGHPDGAVCACGRGAGSAQSPLQFAASAARAIWLAAQRPAQRRVPLELDGRLLADIGVTRQQAQQEAAKSFCVWTGLPIPTVRSTP